MFKLISIVTITGLLLSTPYASALAAEMPKENSSSIEETPEKTDSTKKVEEDKPSEKIVPKKLDTLTLSSDKINDVTVKLKIEANVDVIPIETPLEIINAETFKVLKTCSLVSDCTLETNIQDNPTIIAQSGGVKSSILSFKPEATVEKNIVAPEVNNNQLNAIPTISLTADASNGTPQPTGTFDTSGFATVLAKSSTNLENSGYGIYILDMTINQGEFCVTYITCDFANQFKTGGAHEYQAFIADAKTTAGTAVTYADLTNIQAISNTVSYSRTPWTIEVDVYGDEYSSDYEGGEGYVSVNQTNTQQSTTAMDTPYKEVIHNASTNEWETERVDNGGQIITENMHFVNSKAAQNVIAYIGVPIISPISPYKVIGITDIQASSNRVIGWDNVTTIGAGGSGLQKGGSNPSEDCAQGCAADPINTFSGEFYETTQDLTNISSTNPPLGFSRTYSSLNSNIDGPLGFGWTHNYDMKLSPYNIGSTTATTLVDAPSIEVKQENGSTSYFTKTMDGSYISYEKTKATLTYDSTTNEYVFIRNKTATYRFNTSGQLTAITDLNNNVLTLSYNAGKLSTITDGRNQTISLTWTGSHITKVNNSANKEIIYSYTSDNLTGVNDVMGGNTIYTYITDHRVSQIKRPNGGLVKNTYNTGTTEQKRTIASQTDELGNVTTILNALSNDNISYTTLPDGGSVMETYDKGRMVELTKTSPSGDSRTWSYTYNDKGNLIETVNPDLTKTVTTYDANSNILTTKNELNRTTSFEYNALNMVTKIIDPLNRQVNLTYDAKGNLLTSTDSKGNITTFTYNVQGQKTSIVSPLLNTTTFEYDSKGFLNKTTNSLNQVVSSVNNSSGLPTSITDAKNNIATIAYNNFGQTLVKADATGATTTYIYDITGNLLSIKDAANKISSFTYDLKSNILTSTDALLNVTSVEYDSMEQPFKTIDAKGSETTVTYDGFGNIAESTNELSKITKFKYNWRDQVILTTTPTGKKYTTNYNSDGTVLNTKNPQNFTTTYTYNAAGETLTVKDPLLNTTTFEYDANGKVSKVIKPDNTTQQTTYDAEGKKDTYVDESGKTATYNYNNIGQLTSTNEYNISTGLEYDSVGNLTKKVNLADNSYAEYVYNSRNLLTNINYSDATTDLSYTYNNLSQRSTMTDNNGVTSYTYDAIGRTTKVSNTADGDINYTYDVNSNLATLKTPSNKTATYTYDLANNLTKVNEAAMGNVSYTYNNDNLLSTTTFANTLKTTNTYNASNLLTGMVTKKGTATTSLLDFNYTYDNNSLISSQNTTTATITSTKNYTYDALLRMNAVTTNGTVKTFGFDNLHNITSKPNGDTLTYNADNQLTEMKNTAVSADFDYTYDVRGNRIEKKSTTGTTTNTVASYGYNIANQLTEANLAANPPNVTEIDYNYNGEGLRNKKSKSVGSTTTNEKYIWDSESSIPALLEDKDYTYIYGLDASPIAQIKKGTNAVTYLHTDQLGSVRATSNASGTITEQYLYDEYGTVANGATAHTTTSFGFAGEYLDSDTGFYYLRARWYDPQTAQFTTVDPVLISTHLVYGYTAGNPLSYTDPLGLDWLLTSTQASTDFVYGAWDAVTFGQASKLINNISPGTVNICSSAFAFGDKFGIVVSLIGGGGGIATTIIKTGAKKELPFLAQSGLTSSKAKNQIFKNAKKTDQDGTSIIYYREHPVTKKGYVGKSKNDKTYIKRINAHNKKYKNLTPDAPKDFTYQFNILARPKPENMNRTEEFLIRSGGGPGNKGPGLGTGHNPNNPNGVLENKYHGMDDINYKNAGGDF